MNGKKEMAIEDLYDLLIDNEITHFDPVVDAFKAYDTTGKLNAFFLE